MLVVLIIDLVRHSLHIFVYSLDNTAQAIALAQRGVILFLRGAKMIERFGEVLLLPGNIMLQLEHLQLHRLQRDELVLQTWCDRVVSGALTWRAGSRCFDLISGVVDTGDLSRGKLPELHREARIADPDIIDVDDVEFHQLLGIVVPVVNTGEFPISNYHIALFGGDGAGAKSILILV